MWTLGSWQGECVCDVAIRVERVLVDLAVLRVPAEDLVLVPHCEITYLYISGITTKPKQSECDVNSYNKDTIAICTCEGPDLMKQLIFQGCGVFICTKC